MKINFRQLAVSLAIAATLFVAAFITAVLVDAVHYGNQTGTHYWEVR